MSRPEIRKALGLGLDHCAEIVSAPGALLLQVCADRREFLLEDRFVQKLAVSLCSILRSAAKRRLRVVRGEQRIVVVATECGAARPPIADGIIGDPRANRI